MEQYVVDAFTNIDSYDVTYLVVVLLDFLKKDQEVLYEK